MNNSIRRIAFFIVHGAIQQGISEVHLEPMAGKMVVRHQTSEGLCDVSFMPKHILPELLSFYRRLQSPSLLTLLSSSEPLYAIWDDFKEHDLYLSFSVTPLGEKAEIKIVSAGRKGRWWRRQQRLSYWVSFRMWRFRQGFANFALNILDLSTCTMVILPSALLAKLGLPFGRPLPYWQALYWGCEADLRGVRLPRRNLQGVYLASANLEAADLSGACLRSVGLEKANLAKATLRGAILRRADLRETDLSGADLSEVDLREAVLSKANLQNAQLKGADLRGAYLSRQWDHVKKLPGYDPGYDRGADLTGADLTGADLRGAHYDETTCWPAGFDPAQHGALTHT